MKEYTRPECLQGRTHKIETACGTLYLTINIDENKLVEIRPIIGKVGNCARSMLETIGILLSVILQSDIPRENIAKALSNRMDSNCSNPIKYKGDEYHSCSDVIAKRVIEELLNRGEISAEEETQENKVS